MIAGLFTTALVAFVTVLVVRDRLREQRVHRDLLVAGMRADEAAADTWERYRRQERVNEIGREVSGAFEAQMDPMHTTREEIRSLPEVDR